MTVPFVAVCVATYQRPQYLDGLLASMRTMELDSVRAHLIVADNDPSEAACPIVARRAAELSIPVTYIVEPTRGIASARNHLVSEAATLGADYVAFVDDDQFVEPDWLQKLISVAAATGADAVAGRWVPHYEDGVPEWARASGFWDEPLRGTGTRIERLGTGNVLIKLDAMLQIPGPFDVQRNLTGASDMHFFDAFHHRGFVSVACDESIVHERIPASRATASWMIRRQYRFGLDMANRHRQDKRSLRRSAAFVTGALARIAKHAVLLPPDLLRGRAAVVTRTGRLIQAGGKLVGLTGISYNEYQKIHGK